MFETLWLYSSLIKSGIFSDDPINGVNGKVEPPTNGVNGKVTVVEPIVTPVTITDTIKEDPMTIIEKVGITTTTKTDGVVTARSVEGYKTGKKYTYTEKSDHTELSVKDKITFLTDEVSEQAVVKTILGTATGAIQVSVDTQKAITSLTSTFLPTGISDTFNIQYSAPPKSPPPPGSEKHLKSGIGRSGLVNGVNGKVVIPTSTFGGGSIGYRDMMGIWRYR